MAGSLNKVLLPLLEVFGDKIPKTASNSKNVF